MLNQSISLKRVAVHEAAHAVAAVALELGVRSASVYPDRMKRREKPFGYVARTGDSDDANPRATIIFQFAGAAGERLLMGDNPQGGVTDSEVADELLNRHFQQLRWPSETRGELRHRLQQEAESLVASHRDDIEQIAEALLDRHSLSGLEIERFYEEEKRHEYRM